MVARGITDAVVCPGSRSAPITLALARNTAIQKAIVYDERSAAYIALGMAQQTGSTVVLVCTSGTAALNFGPAIAEAFYMRIPLLVLTADRPPEWTDQRDGQTVRQQGLFTNHIRAEYTLPVDFVHADSLWAMQRMLNEAISRTRSTVAGPVHINIPLREPLYVSGEKTVTALPRVVVQLEMAANLDKSEWDNLIQLLLKFKRKLVVAGQHTPDDQLFNISYVFLSKNRIPCIADANSNISDTANAISEADLLLGALPEEEKKGLYPDLLITFGMDFLSKNLKRFLRNNKPSVHIHVDEDELLADTFGSVTHHIRMKPGRFLLELTNRSYIGNDPTYLDNWITHQNDIKEKINQWFARPRFGEMYVVHAILNNLPENCVMHAANSMPVRYVNFFPKKSVQYFANRGTSGIDGCVSTALGAALKTEKMVLLVTGDMSFLYDRNAFWHKQIPANLRILVLNNHGGGIFRMIDGPDKQPELEEYFVTSQPLGARFLAKEYRLEYRNINSLEQLHEEWKLFLNPSATAKIIEVETNGEQDAAYIQEFRTYLKNGWA